MKGKKINSLAKLFACYPSYRPDAATLAATVGEFIKALERFDAEIVTRACSIFRDRNTAFPPSAGELATICDRIAPRSAPAPLRRAPKPADIGTPAEREARRLRVQEMVDQAKRSLAASTV